MSKINELFCFIFALFCFLQSYIRTLTTSANIKSRRSLANELADGVRRIEIY